MPVQVNCYYHPGLFLYWQGDLETMARLHAAHKSVLSKSLARDANEVEGIDLVIGLMFMVGGMLDANFEMNDCRELHRRICSAVARKVLLPDQEYNFASCNTLGSLKQKRRGGLQLTRWYTKNS